MSLSTSSSHDRLERLGAYLEVDPDNPRLLRDYASEAIRAQEFRACAMAIERLRKVEPPTAGDCLLQARALRLEGRPAESMAILDDALAKFPDDALVRLETAACHFADRAFEAALELLPELAPDAPCAAEVCALRVRLLHHLGQLDEARAAADAFRASQASEPATVVRAVLPVLMDLSMLDDADALAHGLVQRLAPGDTLPYEVYEPLAAVALDRDDVEAARKWTRQALALRDDDGRVWLLEGLAALREGDAAQALNALKRASALMPSHAGSHLARGWACLSARDLDGAHAAFVDGVSASPAFAESHGSLAVVAALRRQVSEATTLIRKAQRLDRDCASAQWAQHLLSGKGGLDEVSRMATQVIAHARQQRRPASAKLPRLS